MEKRLKIFAWLEDTEQPLKKGKTYRVGVKVDSSQTQLQDLNCLLSLSGGGVKVFPGNLEITVNSPQSEDYFFHLRPEREGKLDLYLTLFLSKSLHLLEEHKTVLEVV